MERDGVKYERIKKRFERWIESEALTNMLAEEVRKHPSLTKQVLKITNSDKSEGNLAECKNTVESQAQAD